MIKFSKYLDRLFKNIDISPYSKGNLYKFIVYFYTGVSFIVFTGKDLSSADYFYKDQNGKSYCRNIEKIYFNDFFAEKYEFVNSKEVFIFSSIISFTTLADIPITSSGRSPPV